MTLKNKIIIITLVAMLALYGVVELLYPLLAVSSPVYANTLIVEGWIPDYAIIDACHFFRQHKNYQYLVVTEQKSECIENSSYNACIDSAFNQIIKFGINKNTIILVRASNTIRGRRTYDAAIASQKTITEMLGDINSVDVYTHATHARETLVMYRKAFGEKVSVGIIAAEPQIYNARFWWMSKTGIRLVLKGAIGYLYAQLFTLIYK